MRQPLLNVYIKMSYKSVRWRICERHGANFFQTCLEHLHVRDVLSAQGLQDIPSSGPLVVIANHPFGGLEGVILGALLTQCRPDVKYLGN